VGIYSLDFFTGFSKYMPAVFIVTCVTIYSIDSAVLSFWNTLYLSPYPPYLSRKTKKVKVTQENPEKKETQTAKG
jgi:hypothetical protein